MSTTNNNNNNPLSALFAAVESKASAVATAVQSTTIDPDAFRLRSDAVEPSEGFVAPVAPATIRPYGYQLAAVETILAHGRGIVGFAPGMGKTIVAQMVAAARVAEGQRVLVICPPTLRRDPWAREFQKEFPHLSVAVVEGRKEADLPEADVVIVGDSIVAARKDDILKAEFTTIIVDEAQRLKSSTAQRSVAVREIADGAQQRHQLAGAPRPTVVLLTGTLAMGRPDECWHPARVAGKDVVRHISGGDSFQSFQKAWCTTQLIHVGGGRQVSKVTGCVDPEGLHERLRQSAYLRVEREAVLDMPEKVWVGRSLTLNGELAKYRRMEKDFISFLAATRGREAAERADRAEAVVKLMALWQEAGVAKAKAVSEYVASLVEQGEQVVVMGWHTAAIAALKAQLSTISLGEDRIDDQGRIVKASIRTVEVVGGMTDAQKVAAQDAFRSGKAQVLIGNITAAGTGLNLDSAAHLVFFQFPWTPGDLVQASDRIYRVSQSRNCTIHALSAEGTVDEHLWAVLQSKAAVCDAVNSGATNVSLPTDEDIYDAVLSSYGW